MANRHIFLVTYLAAISRFPNFGIFERLRLTILDIDLVHVNASENTFRYISTYSPIEIYFRQSRSERNITFELFIGWSQIFQKVVQKD